MTSRQGCGSRRRRSVPDVVSGYNFPSLFTSIRQSRPIDRFAICYGPEPAACVRLLTGRRCSRAEELTPDVAAEL